MYVSRNWVIIGSGNGLSPDRRQAITWINTDLLSIEPLGNTSIQENALENVVCEMAAICLGGDELSFEELWFALYWTHIADVQPGTPFTNMK